MKSPWPKAKLGQVLTEVSRPETPEPEQEYRVLGMRWYAGGLFEKGRSKGRDIKAGRIYRVEEGDISYNRLFAWKGSFGVAGPDEEGAYVSNEFPCFVADAAKVERDYLKWYMSRVPFWEEVEVLSTGASRQSRLRLKQERFLSLSVPLPPLPEQRRIVAKIDRIASRVEEAKRLAEQIDGEHYLLEQSLYRFAFGGSTANRALRECLVPNRTTVPICDDVEYKQVTVSMHFKGVSLRQMLLGQKVKTKQQYMARGGQFIYSRIDARNGAFGFVPPELDGAIVTGDFPCFDVNRAVIKPEVLSIAIRTSKFMQAVLDASRGVTNRRRFKEEQLLDLQICVPLQEEQERIVSVRRCLLKSREIHQQVATSLEALVPALLDQAFRGDI